MMRPHEVRPLADAFSDQSLLDEWAALCSRLDASFFLTPRWAGAWWQWAASPPGQCALWRGKAGELEAVVTLVEARERLHPRLPFSVTLWTNLGSGAGSADHHGWVGTNASMPAVWSWLEEQSRKRSLLLRSLAPGLWESAPRGATKVGESRCPRVSLAPDLCLPGEGKFQKRIRYYERQLARLGVSIRWMPPGQLSVDAVELLFQLHDSRHSLKERPSSFRRSQLELHRELVRGSEPPDVGPAAVIADLDGRPIGMLYGFLTRTTFAYFQSGWSGEHANLNLGSVLTASAMRFAAAAGATTFDFLRGPEPYKYRFGATDTLDGTLLLPAGLPGRLLAAKYRVRAALH